MRTSILIGLVALLTFSANARAEEFDPGEAVRAAVTALEQYHHTRAAVDDAMSRKWLPAFLDRLDPQRMVFLEADVAKFQRRENRLDDLARRGDFSFAERVLRRYRQRTEETAKLVRELLETDLDDSIERRRLLPYEDYAATKEERRRRWRERLSTQLPIEERHGRTPAEIRAQLAGRSRRIARQSAEMEEERLCEIYMDALAGVYDPHSGYLSPSSMRRFNITTSIRTYDVGLRLRQRDGRYRIVGVRPSLNDARTDRQLLGWELLALRRPGGELFDLVQLHSADLGQLIGNASGPLEEDNEIILELLHPVTLERASISWPRFLSF
ncbi:MAG: hypothetical protein RIC55_09125 [Pirellulaceae bacterium]